MPVVIGKKRTKVPAAASQSVPRRAKKMSNEDEIEIPATQKPKKVKAKVVKEPKWKTVLKIGKWNPNIKLVDLEKEKSGKDSHPNYQCCLACNIRNVYRAISTKNAGLLKTLVYDVEHVPTVNTGWSHNSQLSSLVTLVQNSEDMNILKAAFDVDVTNFRSNVGTFASVDND